MTRTECLEQRVIALTRDVEWLKIEVGLLRGTYRLDEDGGVVEVAGGKKKAWKKVEGPNK